MNNTNIIFVKSFRKSELKDIRKISLSVSISIVSLPPRKWLTSFKKKIEIKRLEIMKLENIISESLIVRFTEIARKEGLLDSIHQDDVFKSVMLSALAEEQDFLHSLMSSQSKQKLALDIIGERVFNKCQIK